MVRKNERVWKVLGFYLFIYLFVSFSEGKKRGRKGIYSDTITE